MLAVFRVASVILPMKCLQLPTILLTFIYFLFCKAPDPRTNRPRENEKRARKEESYLENEYLRAKRKNLRTPWSAAAIRRRRCGRAEKTRLSQRKDTRRSALPGAAAARWPPSASHYVDLTMTTPGPALLLCERKLRRGTPVV